MVTGDGREVTDVISTNKVNANDAVYDDNVVYVDFSRKAEAAGIGRLALAA